MNIVTKEQIQIRDPFVLRMDEERCYYLFGSTDKDIWKSKGVGFDVYRSTDLTDWEGPFPAFRPAPDFWAEKNFWAPEVHAYRGKYYMFATFKADGVCRGTQVLAASHPFGPFTPHSDGPVTPKDWECLDGTLYVDDEGMPWVIFCHEWVQIKNGTICAMRLSESLDRAIGEPIELFAAGDAPWADPIRGDNYVTDGPFLHRGERGELLMLWSSFADNLYAQGIAKSASGGILGPWEQSAEPLYKSDGGHGMLFRTFGGQLMLALHTPNKTPDERPVFIPLEERDGQLIVSE